MRKKQTIAEVRKQRDEHKAHAERIAANFNSYIEKSNQTIADLNAELRVVQAERDASRKLAHALMQDNDTRCKAMDTLAETMRVAFLSSPVVRKRIADTELRNLEQPR